MATNNLIGGALTLADYLVNQNTSKSVAGNLNAGYDQAKSDITGALQPYSDVGLGAINNLNQSGGIDLTQDPGYQFRKQEAANEVERAAAARGYNMSTNVLKSLNDRISGVASQEYGNAWDRNLQLMNLGKGAATDTANGLAYLTAKQGEAGAARELMQGMNRGGVIDTAAGALAGAGGGSNTLAQIGQILGGGRNNTGSSFMDDLGNLVSGSVFDPGTWSSMFDGVDIGGSFWDGMGEIAKFFR